MQPFLLVLSYSPFALTQAMVVEMLSVKADASVLAQSASAAAGEAKALRSDKAAVERQLDAQRSEVYRLEQRLAVRACGARS